MKKTITRISDSLVRVHYEGIGEDTEEKVSLILDFTERPGEVADPWYTDDFDATWDDVLQGCTALLRILTGKK